MAVMSSEEFVRKAKDIANNYKTLYVLGCFGAPMTSSNKKRYINNCSYNKKRASIINSASSDTFGFDCVCLIKGILWGWNGNKNAVYGGAKYCSNGVPDVGADQMMNYCSGVSTNFNNIIPGEAVHMFGHIGIYIGNGLAVECTPKWKNKVQITAVGNIGSKSGYNTRTWTNHGKLRWIDYNEDYKPDDKPSDNSQKERTKSWQIVMNKVYGCGLAVDGSYGPASRAAANKHQLYKKKLVGLRIRNDYVRWLQNRLNELGYHLAVDGSFWTDTSNAVKSFQRSRGIKVDGYVGQNTVAQLLK